MLTKSLEHTVVHRLQTYLERHYIRGIGITVHSAAVASPLDKNKCVLLTVTNLLAAFDTIGHAKLIHVLEY